MVTTKSLSTAAVSSKRSNQFRAAAKAKFLRFVKEKRVLLLDLAPSKTAERLDALFELGRLANRALPDHRYGKRSLENLAKESGLSFEMLRKAITFANGYTEKQLEQLKRSAPKISFRHVIHLLPLTPRLRRQFEKRLGKETWTVVQLQREIRRLVPTRNKGGRKIAELVSPSYACNQLLNDLHFLTGHWQAWRQLLRSSLNRDQVPEGCVAALEDLTGHLKSAPKRRSSAPSR